MGGWSEYPDGNDCNIDMFSAFLSRYFHKSDDSELEMIFSEEDDYDPGLTQRMSMRNGGPEMFDKDLTNDAMDIYLELFKMYIANIDSVSVVGFAISLCRLLNNEEFGIFGEYASGLPNNPSPLRNDINKLICDLIVVDNEISAKISNYFNSLNSL